MGSLVLSNLKNTAKDDLGYTYTDIHLDIDEQLYTRNNKKLPSGRDIKVSYDELAIKNSIFNIFNTIPGERFLLPEFGSDLRQYLFRPVTKFTADSIGNHILHCIRKWEPRVIVDYINVIGRQSGSVTSTDLGNFSSAVQQYLKVPVSEDEYIVTVIIVIPLLKIKTDLEGVLSSGGFREIQL